MLPLAVLTTGDAQHRAWRMADDVICEITGTWRLCSKPLKLIRRKASLPPSHARRSRLVAAALLFATGSILNKEQERLMKEKEDKKQAGRGGAAKFR